MQRKPINEKQGPDEMTAGKNTKLVVVESGMGLWISMHIYVCVIHD